MDAIRKIEAALPIVLYHHAHTDANGSTLLPSEGFGGYGIGVPLVRLSDALTALASKDAEIARLREALGLLLYSDPNIANATDGELSTAANDVTQDGLLRNQATAVLRARAALTQPTEQP